MENKASAFSAPNIEQLIFGLYELINRQISSSEFGGYATFLNWGYIPENTPSHSVVKLPDIYLNKNSTRLVLELVGDTPLEGKDVLDVGCGRGGALSTLSSFFGPRTLTGIDLTPSNIAFCQDTFKGITFHEGNAESLPFPDSTFDVVMNIESSSNYLNIDSFFLEACRVLKPEGYFLYTDIFRVSDLEDYLGFLNKAGLKLDLDRDITPNVLLARDEASTDFSLQIKEFEGLEGFTRDECRQVVDFYAAHKGTRSYEGLRSRQFVYRMFRFNKVGSPQKDLLLSPGKSSESRASGFYQALFGQELIEKIICMTGN